MTPLAAFEEIIDASGAAPRIEALLPIGVRRRQLRVRTLLAGMTLTQADCRPAHLTRVRDTLIALPAGDQARLGVTEDRAGGPHLLTCRQTERTFRLVAGALGGDHPGGLPPDRLQRICDALLEASIPAGFKNASRPLPADWTDLESFSRPPPRGTSDCADPEASWGHRKNNLLRTQDEPFYGYYLSAEIMMPEENGPAVPEFARRAAISSCRHDPVRAFAPALTAMPGQQIPPGDILDDSGYAHRDAGARAIPLRTAGAQLVQDLHPQDRGPKGTHHGAIIANGNPYCPCTPRTLLELGPLPPGAAREQATAHDAKTAEPASWRTASSAASPATTPTATTACSAPCCPPHGPDPAHVVRRDAAHRPQPARPRRLGRQAGRQRAASRRRAPAENPETAPQDAHRAYHSHTAALAREHAIRGSSTRREHPGSARTLHADNGSTPGNRPGRTGSHHADTNRAQDQSGCTRAARVPECQSQM